MKRLFVILLIVLSTIWIPFVSHSGTQYYVATNGNDANDGSLAAPWRTIQKAANSATPGSTVNIRGGIYNERITMGVSGTEAGGFITFRSYPSEQAIIDGTNLPLVEQNALLSIIDRHYIIIQGLELRNLETTLPNVVPMGIFIAGSSTSIEIRHSSIHHIATQYQNMTGSDAHGIAVYGNNSASIKRIIIESNEIAYLKLGSSEAVAINGNVDGFSIRHNRIHDVDNIALVAIGYEAVAPSNDRARNGIISNNRVWNVDSSTNPAYGATCTPLGCSGGDLSAGGIYVDGGTAITIESNLVLDANIGIEIASEHAGKSADLILVRNNSINNVDFAGIAIGGYAADETGAGGGSAHDNLIINNTVYSPNQGSAFVGQYRVHHNTISNNIFAAAEDLQWEIVDPSTFTQNTTTTNILKTVSSTDPNPDTLFKSVIRPSDADLRLSTSAPSIHLFLHITTLSEAYNAGTSLDAGPTDIDGEPRLRHTLLDIGSDEVQ